MTYLTTRNSLKLRNWHIRSDIQNHIVKACNSKFRRNLQQKPVEFENRIVVRSCPRVSGKKLNLEQSIIETASSHIHSLIDNFEAYIPKQQATKLQSKLWILSLFGEQHLPGHWGTNLKNDLCQLAFISRRKHAEFWVRALDGSSGVTRGDICPRVQHFGGAKLRLECYVLIWKCQMSVDANNDNLQCVECHCEISLRSPRFAKREVMKLSDVSRQNSVYRRPLVVVVWLRAAPQLFQKARAANFPASLSFYSCVAMGRESSFHRACKVLYCVCFQSSNKTFTMLLPKMCRGTMNEATVPHIQGSGSSKEWNYHKCVYQNLVTRPVV